VDFALFTYNSQDLVPVFVISCVYINVVYTILRDQEITGVGASARRPLSRACGLRAIPARSPPSRVSKLPTEVRVGGMDLTRGRKCGMNPFGLVVAVLQVGAAIVYARQGKTDHAVLWGLYALANVVLLRMGR
jgi:hypothetical protein